MTFIMTSMSWMPSEEVELFRHVACEMRYNAHGDAHRHEAACDAACSVSVQRCAAEGAWPGARVHTVCVHAPVRKDADKY